MALASPPPFRECLPKLHAFNGVVDSQFADAAARAQLLEWLAQFVADDAAATRTEEERKQRRTKYFLEDVFADGDGRLLDSTTPSDGCIWAHYFNDENRLSGDYSPGVPAQVRNGQYHIVERDANDPARWVRTAVPCYTPGDGNIDICAWTPVELAPRDVDPNLLPQSPLPPRQLGRQYSLPEIARGLAALHDVDGGFEPFIPRGHELEDWDWKVTKIALRQSGYVVQQVDDDWVTSLAPLRDRLFAAIAAHDGQNASLTGSLPDGDDATDDSLLSPPRLAEILGVHPARKNAFAKMLERQRIYLGDGGFQEMKDVPRNQHKYVYRLGSVRSLAGHYRQAPRRPTESRADVRRKLF